MTEEVLLLFLFCLEIGLVLNLTIRVKSRFYLPCRFLHMAKQNEKKSQKEDIQIQKFKCISLNFCSTSQCELSQLSFHILKQCFLRQEKYPTSMPHRCPFKSEQGHLMQESATSI